MLLPLSKLSPDALDYVVKFTFANKSSMSLAFPDCEDETALGRTLKTSSERWNVLVMEHPIALFTLRTIGATAFVDSFLPESAECIDTAIPALREHLTQKKIEPVLVNVSEDLEVPLMKNGFQKYATLLRFAANAVETKLMPILPLSNLSERDLSALIILMRESYARSREKSPSDTTDVEDILRGIFAGNRGTFLSEASFISKASDKLVSACLITADGKSAANVIELFTHPLYRARGLATTEIAMSMNRLRKTGYSTLRVVLKEDDAVARRLFEKLAFKQDARTSQMIFR